MSKDPNAFIVLYTLAFSLLIITILLVQKNDKR